MESCLNGSSEMVSNLAASVITWLMNLLMMHFPQGEDGVAAVYGGFVYPVLLYGGIPGIFQRCGAGYQVIITAAGMGAAAYGVLVSVWGAWLCSLLMTGAAIVLGKASYRPCFCPDGTAANELTYHGYLIYSINYLFAGMNIFISSLFTALSNGKVSAMISMIRTFWVYGSGNSVVFLDLADERTVAGGSGRGMRDAGPGTVSGEKIQKGL